MTTFVRVDALLTTTVVCDPEELFFLQNSLNPIMTPFLSLSGGSCQDAVILVELFAVTVKLVGAAEGAAIEQHYID